MTQPQGSGGVPTTSAVDNPSIAPDKQRPDRGRIPMSLPVQKLAAVDIPGYHTHWMRGDPVRLNQALRAGYTFVEQDEVDLNTFGITQGEDDSGHTDLGSRVSVVAGKAEGGGAERLYLMKLPLSLWEEDQAGMAQRQANIAAQLRGDKGFSEAGMDTSHRYVGKQSDENRNIFIPKPNRST